MSTLKRIGFGFSFLSLCMFLCFSGLGSNSAFGQNKRVKSGDPKYNYTPDEAYIASLSFETARDNLVSAINLASNISLQTNIRRGSSTSVLKDKKDNTNLITVVEVNEKQFEIKYVSGKEQGSIVFIYNKSKMPDAFEAAVGEGKKGIIVKDGVNGFWLTWSDENTAVKNARLYLDAVYFLKTVMTAQMLEKFKEKADVYISLDPKPEISEEMRKCIVQATALTKDKKYEDAIKLYEKAMEIDETFPDAHFNLALLQSQVNDFSSAIIEMKKYLILVPNAKDARAAQDKIYEWELKGK